MITLRHDSQQRSDVTADAERFKALGSHARMALLTLIGTHGGTLSVDDLQARLGVVLSYELAQPTISHHLAILARAGFVEYTHEGLERYYRLKGEGLVYCMDALTRILAHLGGKATP